LFIGVNGIELWVEISGPRLGEPLLVISGTGADLRADVDRDGNRAEHPAARAGMRVIRFDQRGLGQSTKPSDPYSMALYADDAAELVSALISSDHIDDAPVNVVGISFGGMVAQHLAIRHPDRVKRLVLCCTSTGGQGGSSYDLLALASVPEPERSHIGARISDTRNDPTADPPVYAPGAKGAAIRGAIASRLRAEDPAGALGYRRQLEARAGHDSWAELLQITSPTLVCGGVFDAQASPQNQQALAARIPNARLRMFNGGHGFLYQDLEAWAAILEFLQASPA
jgi:3-oxoadipate enol-lactonase